MTATQYSGDPFPEPIRVSVGFTVTDLDRSQFEKKDRIKLKNFRRRIFTHSIVILVVGLVMNFPFRIHGIVLRLTLRWTQLDEATILVMGILVRVKDFEIECEFFLVMDGITTGSNAESQMDMGSSSYNDFTYVPQVKFEQILKIGQELDSLDETRNFYNEYAREASFAFMTFYVVHNHVLTIPRKVHLLRSHCSMFTTKKALTQQVSASNVSIHNQISILEVGAGGLENIGCIENDFYNAHRDKIKMYVGHDAQMLYEYFQAEKDKNLKFSFTIKMDIENIITHCFRTDVECKKSYEAFRDVVVFDTTYNTNRYGMIFGLFLGVNHHYQTTLFACAFLRDETTESFLNAYEIQRGPEEFEAEWAEVIEHSGLSTNKWLKSMYEIHFKWILTYVNDTFSAGMSSSQKA
ncbi:protein FAR1-RELATED SEQUENCE 2-like [Tripterygium wilfordii]|uniref:protein FAR1-RELATED SEQUENCE 2-like n=1 Tax=Tripterygium wilfordii TaxID=458696 RepID=UPI0018F809FB|nr:protein FAR1-RELATED SEQUENCE 2-like [Tripterygium wilfordii]